MELVLEQPEIESTDVLAPTPLRSVPKDADVAEVDSGLKRKRATGDDGAGPSKRVHHLSLGFSRSIEEETPDASPTLAAKDDRGPPPPNVEATSDSSAPVTHAAQSPPQTGPKAFEGMPVDQLMEEFDMKDEEILLLKTQLADAQAEAESSRSYAQNLAEEKMALLVKVEQERADAAEYKASYHWAVKYLEGGKNNHFAGLEKHSISLKLSLQHCKEQMKNKPVCKENASNVFRKEREQYHEIQDLKSQMQDKNIVINELKKFILVTKEKSVETQFDKPPVVRQPNAQRIPKPSVLGKPTPFSNSPEMRSFQMKQSVNKTNVSDGLFKQVTQQNLPQNRKQAEIHSNVLKPGMYRIATTTTQTRTPQLQGILILMCLHLQK
ncbi:hypothetical protein Tco_0872356 [Tanacetum coccineum]